jgi:hypothetical protein
MINNHRPSSSKMEDIRQILLRNPELPHEENLHYLYQLEFLNNNLTPSSKMEDNQKWKIIIDMGQCHQIPYRSFAKIQQIVTNLHFNTYEFLICKKVTSLAVIEQDYIEIIVNL